MRLERKRRRRAQSRRRVVPDLVEQVIALPQPARERRDQPALAVEAVIDVLAQFGLRVPDDRPVARAERGQPQRLQAAQRLR